MCKVLVLFFLGLGILGCGKVKNSSSSDGGSIVGTAEFVSAMEIVQSKCLSCHNTWATYSSDDYVKKGLVFKGSPANSSLYTRIRGNDVGQAGDMPPGQPTLTYTEIKEIKAWINSL
ncbi:MAG: hypothetical protein JNL11_16270 [Bdellovibrionaceae bacterium]|nr:hypothetical protein [Pseudobdellovibrionaceae bacterium]